MSYDYVIIMVLHMCNKGLESADWSRPWELIHTPARVLLLFTTTTTCSKIWLIKVLNIGDTVLTDNEGTGVVKETITRGYAIFYNVELCGIDIQVERVRIVTR